MKDKPKLDNRLHTMVTAEEKEAVEKVAKEKDVSGAKIVRTGLRAYLRRMKAL